MGLPMVHTHTHTHFCALVRLTGCARSQNIPLRKPWDGWRVPGRFCRVVPKLPPLLLGLVQSTGERSCVPAEPWHGPRQRGALLLPHPPKCVQEVNLLASFSPHLYILCNLQKVLEKSLPAAESGAAVQFPNRTALAMSSASLHPPLCLPPLSV